MLEAGIAAVALIIAAVACGLAVRAERRVARLTEALATAPSPVALAGTVGALAGRVTDSETRLDAVEARAERAIVHVGLVRFNAFAGVGGQQSFALALLDPHADGVVVSALHARDTTRVYVKPILGGVPGAPLADEEVAALRDAGFPQAQDV